MSATNKNNFKRRIMALTINVLRSFVILMLFFPLNFAQQQQTISWPSLADSPWPVLRGDMQGTGRSKYIGPKTNNVIWRKDMPLGVLYGPIIGYNDILYMGERALGYDTVNYFYAVNGTGQTFWTFQTESWFPNNGGPVQAADSTIYFFSRNEKMYALKPNGEKKWDFPIWANFRLFQPVAKNGDLYVPLLDTLVVISSNGNLKNRIPINKISQAISFSVGGDTLFFITGQPSTLTPGALHASDLYGNIHWSYHVEAINWGVPVVDNLNRVYFFGSDTLNGIYYHFLYCLNPDGTLNWKYNAEFYDDYSSPTIDKNGNIILNGRKIIDSVEYNYIISLDYEGNENWFYPFQGDFDDHYIDHGLVCDAEGKIYCGSSTGGFFYCIDNNGELLWKLDIGDYEYDTCPAIGSDGTLYIGLHKSLFFHYHSQNLIAVKDSPTVIIDTEPQINDYNLFQNFPNPFNPVTKISYVLKEKGFVSIIVYDLLGRELEILVNKNEDAGNFTVSFDASNLPSGVYIYKMRVNDFTTSKKMLVLK